MSRFWLLFAFSLILTRHALAAPRALKGIASPTPPSQRLKGVQFTAQAKRGSPYPETIGGLKFFEDDVQLFEGRTIGVWCDLQQSGVLLRGTDQDCYAVLEDWEWEEAYEANKIELIFENHEDRNGQDSEIIIKDGEFWLFNKNIMKSAVSVDELGNGDSRAEGDQTALLRTGRLHAANVFMHLPPAGEDDAIPVEFKIQSLSGPTALSVKGIAADGSETILDYECSSPSNPVGSTQIDNTAWFSCYADASGDTTFTSIDFAALSDDAEISKGLFFFDRINIWESATELGTGVGGGSLAIGEVTANTFVRMDINPDDCRKKCCFVQETYSPYPSCKLHCDDDICLQSQRGPSYPSEEKCCEEVECKERPTECWTASSHWPERTCAPDVTKCFEDKVFATESECCAAGGAFPDGCTDVEGEYGPCWKQRSDAPYPHCQRIANAECKETDGIQTEDVALGKTVRGPAVYYTRKYAVDGSLRSCSWSYWVFTPWIRIDLRESDRDISEVVLSTYFSYNDVEIRLGNVRNAVLANPICTDNGQRVQTQGYGTSQTFPCTGSGRFLFIRLPRLSGMYYYYWRLLSVCDVKVIARHKYNDELVSLRQPAVQSSTQNYGAALAVDGDTQNYFYALCSRTQREYEPYWGVDLGTVRWITRIKIAKIYWYYYRNYRVDIRIGNSDNFLDNPVQRTYTFYSAHVEILLPKLVQGRYISIHVKNRYARLRLCEVQVFAGPIAWGPSNYFPTRTSCCNSEAFDANGGCTRQPPTPCYVVGSWWPRRECHRVNDPAICTRGWDVWPDQDDCCSSGFGDQGCSEV